MNHYDTGYFIEDKEAYYGNITQIYNGGYIEYKKLYYSKKYIANSYRRKSGYVKEISSSNKNEYPNNGVKGDYWYELVG